MKKRRNFIQLSGVFLVCVTCLWTKTPYKTIEASRLGATHIGTFDGNTIFTTSSENGVNPGLFIEVMDDNGNLTQYESEEGVITIPNTKEGSYVTKAKLLGKTKYRDQDTDELLDTWEEGRDLKLESVENPTLMITNGFNRFNKNDLETIGPHDFLTNEKFEFVSGDKWAISGVDWRSLYLYSEDGRLVAEKWSNGRGQTVFTLPDRKDISYFRVQINSGYLNTAMLVKGEEHKEYSEYQSKIATLHFEKEIGLGAVGDVTDELDLMTGQFTQKIDEMTINGEETWVVDPNYRNDTTTKIYVSNYFNDKGYQVYTDVIAETLPYVSYETIQSPSTDYPCISNSTVGSLNIRLPKFQDENVSFVESYLKENNIRVLAKLKVPITKKVEIATTYKFPLLSNIQMSGTIQPVITSITIPTNELAFVLNPNQEAGQQFIAPEFEVSNNSNAPLSLTLKIFEQTTDILNDVLPTKYDSWEGLDKEQSKDFALGLVSQPSDGWLSRVDTPHYVSETTNKELGTIQPKGTVGFNFIAHHGQAFSEVLNPSYRLTFVFDLLN